MLFPPTPPSLPDREGSVGDATVEASVLPGGGSRRPEGGRCERLWGSPLRGRDRWAARKAWCRRPLSREEPSVPFTRTLPPYSLSPPPGMEPCAAWSPRGGRGTATLPFRGVQQTRGGVGTEGRGRGSTRAGAAPGGDPPAEELGKSGHSRRGDTGRFSAALHPLLLRLSFLLPARAKSFFRPGGGWAGGEAAGELPLRAAPLYVPRTKRWSTRGHRPGRSAQGGLRWGRKGTASRRGRV